MEKQITRAEAVNILRNRTGSRFFGVSFIKKDKSVRTMTARLGVKKHLRGGKNSVALIPAYITVFDNNACDYRNVNVNTIFELKVNGVSYKVN